MSDATWARAAPWLEAALSHAGGTHRLSDVRAMVEGGEARAWFGERAALVALIEDEPCERRLLIWLAGGEFAELVMRLRPEAEAWGREHGCRRVLIIGRAGWERALAPEGYAPMARIIGKEL